MLVHFEGWRECGRTECSRPKADYLYGSEAHGWEGSEDHCTGLQVGVVHSGDGGVNLYPCATSLGNDTFHDLMLLQGFPLGGGLG